MTITKTALLEKIAEMPTRSAWDRGIKETAAAMVEMVDGDAFLTVKTFRDLHAVLLRGAKNWKQYAFGACGDICSEPDICKRFCSQSQFEKFRHGMKKPYGRPNWLTLYVDALSFAESKIHGILIADFAD